jgi:lambda family phage portal protein
MKLWETPLWQATVAKVARLGKTGQRQYAAARPSRLTSTFASTNSSANAELHTSLTRLRSHSRQLVRDSAYAKRAKKIVVDNVIGTGIGMQAEVRGTRKELRTAVNDAIETAWWDWCRADRCHTGGQLHFSDLERQSLGQVFEAGEVFVRLHFRPFSDSKVPLALELIEPERLADDMAEPGPIAAGAKVVQGVEVDDFYRPVAYWLKKLHPGEVRFNMSQVDRVERVPADQIIHLRLIDRWPQVRGEPWMHAVIRKLADIDGYTEAEIVAARAASMYVGVIQSPDDTASFGEEQDDGSYQLPLEPGTFEKLQPGEQLNFVSPNRPNSALDPFLRYMLREMAAGVGTSYESLSRDYSQSNYSSSRLALLEDRDNWRALQGWFIRMFRDQVHRVWLRQAAYARAIQGVPVMESANAAEKFEAVSFKPRGWSWVDPTKEVEAYKEAVKAGFTTRADVIAQTANGVDIEEVDAQRERELKSQKERGLSYDTDPGVYIPSETGGHMMLAPDGDLMPMAAAVGDAPAPDESAAAAPEDDAKEAGDEPARSRVISLRR